LYFDRRAFRAIAGAIVIAGCSSSSASSIDGNDASARATDADVADAHAIDSGTQLDATLQSDAADSGQITTHDANAPLDAASNLDAGSIGDAAFTVTAATPVFAMTPGERAEAGLTLLGDGTIGATNIDGTYTILGPMASGYQIIPGNVMPENYSAFTQRITTTNIADTTTWQAARDATPLHKAGVTSSSAFDRDYAAGGPAYYDSESGYLFHIYHGEFWPLTDANSIVPQPYYPGLGLAFSKDKGASWIKLGEIVAPNVQLPKIENSSCLVDVGGGTWVVSNGYVYVYFIA
jgi:hypothetical protein